MLVFATRQSINWTPWLPWPGKSKGLWIPRATLVGSIKNAAVYVVRDGIAYWQPIVVGQQTNEFIEVLSGLEVGDTVVTSGQNNLVDNTKVAVVAAD